MENYINIVNNDIYRLSSVMESLQKNMAQVKSENVNQQVKIKEQNEQIAFLLKDKQQLNNDKTKLQSQMVLISVENDRLVQLVFEKIAAMQERWRELKINQEKLVNEVGSVLNELKDQQEACVQQLVNKLEEQRQHILNLENQSSLLIRKKDKLQQDNEQYTLKLVQIEKQKHIELGTLKEQAQGTIKQLEGQISDIKENFEDYVSQAEEEKQQFQQMFEAYKQEYYIQSDLKIQFNKEKQMIENTISTLKQKINELEGELDYFRAENQKLQQLSVERMKEIDQWKRKLQENKFFFFLQKEIQSLRVQVEENKQQLYTMQEENLSIISEKNQLQTQLNSSNETLKNKISELIKSAELISFLKSQSGNTASKLHNFQNLSEGLKKQQDTLEGDLLLKCELIENVKGKNQELAMKVEKLEEENIRLQQQLEEKMDELITKDRELELVKLNSHASSSSTAILTQKVNQTYSIQKPSNWNSYQQQHFSTQS